MKVELHHAPDQREIHITARVSNLELHRHMRPDVIMAEVRSQIASRLADQVMAKIGPALAQVLANEHK